MQADWLIEHFDGRRHDRSGFSCGNEELDGYLKLRASPAERYGTARVFVAVRPDEAVVRGYYTLSNLSIVRELLPEPQSKQMPKVVPAILLGRFAVDEQHQNQGLGKTLLMNALARSLKLSEKSGCVAVVLDAIDDQALEFYTKRGFSELTDDPKHLFMSTKVIKGLRLPG